MNGFIFLCIERARRSATHAMDAAGAYPGALYGLSGAEGAIIGARAAKMEDDLRMAELAEPGPDGLRLVAADALRWLQQACCTASPEWAAEAAARCAGFAAEASAAARWSAGDGPPNAARAAKEASVRRELREIGLDYYGVVVSMGSEVSL